MASIFQKAASLVKSRTPYHVRITNDQDATFTASEAQLLKLLFRACAFGEHQYIPDRVMVFLFERTGLPQQTIKKITEDALGVSAPHHMTEHNFFIACRVCAAWHVGAGIRALWRCALYTPCHSARRLPPHTHSWFR